MSVDNALQRETTGKNYSRTSVADFRCPAQNCNRFQKNADFFMMPDTITVKRLLKPVCTDNYQYTNICRSRLIAKNIVYAVQRNVTSMLVQRMKRRRTEKRG